MFIATEAGLCISRTMTKKEDGKTLWGFRILDMPYSVSWRESPAEALAELLRRILLDQADLLGRHIVEARDAHADTYVRALESRLARVERLAGEARGI
jgi:hypothetical protein